MAENTEIVAVGTLMSEPTGTSICSIDQKTATPEQRKMVYNAMNNPTHKVSDFINKKIAVENVLIETVDLMDDETGEIDRVPRTVLITPKGESYTATSKGVFNSIKNAYKAFGAAPWSPAIEFEVKQVNVGRGSMLTLEMV